MYNHFTWKTSDALNIYCNKFPTHIICSSIYSSRKLQHYCTHSCHYIILYAQLLLQFIRIYWQHNQPTIPQFQLQIAWVYYKSDFLSFFMISEWSRNTTRTWINEYSFQRLNLFFTLWGTLMHGLCIGYHRGCVWFYMHDLIKLLWFLKGQL